MKIDEPVSRPRAHATTIIAVMRPDGVAMAGDGQVTFGEVVMKHGARKIRTLRDGTIVAGFAGAVADALTLIEPFWRSVSGFDLGLFGATLLALLGKFAPLVPASFYLLAVLGAAGILDQIGKGEYFSARNIRALSDMGGSMLWGAAWAAFVAPAVAEWVAGRGGYRFTLEPEILVIGIIGMSILVIGRLFARARELENEMGEIV